MPSDIKGYIEIRWSERRNKWVALRLHYTGAYLNDSDHQWMGVNLNIFSKKEKETVIKALQLTNPGWVVREEDLRWLDGLTDPEKPVHK